MRSSKEVEDTMRARLRRLRRDERGMSLVFVGLGFISFMAATTLAIDIGMFMTARSQTQNAADAGALAGAVALIFNDFDDRTPSGPAVQSAINASTANLVMGSSGSVLPADVTFPTGPSGQNDRVRVTVRRAAARSNPVATLFGPLLGVNTVDVAAVATAEAAPANAATCVMPFTIPDKWSENTTPPWDPNDDFDLFGGGGNPLPNPDVYIPPGQTGHTGYDPEIDKGLQVTLKTNNQNKTAPSFYNAWRLPGSTGASDYRWNIGNCNTNIVAIGDLMDAEPGNMVGPTRQGVEDLIDKDPGAYWDTSCNCVKGSAFGKSPRVAVVPLYDPVYYENGKHNGSNASLKVANYLGFFIEGMQSNEVVGRITPITGLVKGGGGPLPTGAFAKVIRLVE
jgi:Flp pilus assembly protein TadG